MYDMMFNDFCIFYRDSSLVRQKHLLVSYLFVTLVFFFFFFFSGLYLASQLPEENGEKDNRVRKKIARS